MPLPLLPRRLLSSSSSSSSLLRRAATAAAGGRRSSSSSSSSPFFLFPLLLAPSSASLLCPPTTRMASVFASSSSSFGHSLRYPSSCHLPLRHASAMSSANSAANRSQYVLPDDQPVVTLDARTAFEALTQREQLYAHYISRASFYGGLIVLLQTSPESPGIFRLIQSLNVAEKPEELKAACLAAGVTEQEFNAFQVYAAGVYANMGNYKGFGDSKILPNVSSSVVEKIILASAASKQQPDKIKAIWAGCKERMFSLTKRQKTLDLGEKGVTKYLSENIGEQDSDKINRFFKQEKLEGYTNRAFKTEVDGKTKFEIRNAGVEQKTLKTVEFEGATFEVTTGDYAPLMKLVNDNLEKAIAYAANDEERAMLQDYIRSFTEGSLDAHKDGSRHWIKNKGPTVETYIGFIETYRDPVGMRGEFEGFVAMVNKDQSQKFQELVNKAEELLPRLPWPKEFEKDKFLLPDFTSLDVLSFAGSGIPAGINIPNYDEIRQSEGFKNVNLGNVIQASYKEDKRTTFVSLEDHEILKKFKVPSFTVQVGLHELLGHGSGKLLQSKDGTLNFPSDLVNPLTSAKVDKYYEEGETFDSKFTSLGSSYEECRAECVGLYLSCFKDVLNIFGHSDDADDVIYANWLSLCLAALKGIEMFSPETQAWKQAHSQARFVILQVLLEAGEGFVSVSEQPGDDGKPDLLLSMDRSKLESVGKPAIGDFLKQLQIYKSTGDYDTAKAMYDKYSELKTDGARPFAKWRDIVMDRKLPRKIMVQANTVLKDEKLNLVEYEASPMGMAQSWAERFPSDEYEQIDQFLEQLVLKDQPYFQSEA